MAHSTKENTRMYTKEGFQALQDELTYLKLTRREEIKKEIEVARSFGDLSENAEYDEARNEQTKVEARILELESLIEHGIVIDETCVDEKIANIGSNITIEFDDGDTESYKIVGSNEANPDENLISDQSPIGHAVLGHKIGDSVEVLAPGRIIHIVLKDVSRQK